MAVIRQDCRMRTRHGDLTKVVRTPVRDGSLVLEFAHYVMSVATGTVVAFLRHSTSTVRENDRVSVARHRPLTSSGGDRCFVTRRRTRENPSDQSGQLYDVGA